MAPAFCYRALRVGKDFTLSILITDLTYQKEVNAQLKRKNDQLAAINQILEHSNEDLQQFASVASHDLQEPLRKITFFGSSLKASAGQELTGEAGMYLNKIITSANRMKMLITDILNYSRISKDNDNFEVTDLKQLVHELLEDMEVTIKEKNASIVVEEMSAIAVIKDLVRQVFQNLISNALKFTRTGENPHITIWRTEEPVLLSENEAQPVKSCYIHVKDNGIGFDEQQGKKIFNLFERLNGNAYEGTGIGLAICKKIIEKHGGYITVKSEPGLGSEFIIGLPLLQENKMDIGESLEQMG